MPHFPESKQKTVKPFELQSFILKWKRAIKEMQSDKLL